ncbi:4-O-dimethylallyl-L-tyrosine synthase [Sparassis crispa]|uniref:4-O-dimethylallyl-L-tyrosine synthase n=1 Tax=Sparassis crispa TaxID=139825 RepID=A0A401GQ76_9APHY|nr:4-O-dimethylallyl-L-tyrosine synthase [Sparassis crispa]GBE84299.1 4-O-dimethylallyl-L-tyrosine synthase [Sparassis crispa]
MLAASIILSTPISPIAANSPNVFPVTHKTLSESVYDVLNLTLRFGEDERFWWETSGRILANMFQHLGYSVTVQFLHMLFFHVRILPFMGPRPNWQNKPVFKSYMTDDHTPIEVSWIVGPEGSTTVRYAIEPIEKSLFAKKSAALRMVDEMRPVVNHLDLSWFFLLDKVLVWHGQTNALGTKHLTQYFLGFDCSHTGAITLKAYFLPEIKAALTGVSKEMLTMHALKSLDAELTIPWKAIIMYFNTLPSSMRPDIEILATDCGAPEDSRIKALVDLWRLVMGVDTAMPDWKEQHLVSPSSNNNHITCGLLLYYELKPGCAQPLPKVYLPVRHYCTDDLAVARGMQAFHRARGNTLLNGYVRDVEAIFGRHRPLGVCTGIHTYVSLAIKRKEFEVTSYFNPEAYGPERFSP